MREFARPTPMTTRSEEASAGIPAGTPTGTSTGLSSGTLLTPLLTFRLGQQDYALPVDDVIEVAAMVEMTRIAGTTPALPGIINRHGQPLQLIDLRALFEQPVMPVTASTLFIVVQGATGTPTQQQSAGLIVDEVLQVEYLPVTGSSNATGTIRYVREIISQSSRLIQVVSLPALLKACLPDASEVESR